MSASSSSQSGPRHPHANATENSGRDSKRLYSILGVSTTATHEEIKRAYRRMALIYHPDKNPQPANGDGAASLDTSAAQTTSTTAERFKEINQAWEILGDENLRQVYDRFGMTGVDMARQLGGDGNDSFPAMLIAQGPELMVTSMCLMSIVVAVLALFPIFVALKADGAVGWSWGVVFIPIWLFDAAGFLIILSQSRTVADSGDGDEGEADDSQTRRRRKLRSRIDNLAWFVKWALFFAFQVLLVLKLDNVAPGLSWAAAFIPYFILELHPLLRKALIYVRLVVRKSSDHEDHGDYNDLVNQPIWRKIFVFIHMFRRWILRIIFAILIVLRADEVINSSWAAVFIPVYLIMADILISPLIEYKITNIALRSAAIPDDQKSTIRNVNLAKIIGSFLLTVTLLATIGMFIARLNSAAPSESYSVAVILIPVFVVLALTFCCCCCCLPCLVIASSADLESQSEQPLPLNIKRIEYRPVENTGTTTESTIEKS